MSDETDLDDYLSTLVESLMDRAVAEFLTEVPDVAEKHRVWTRDPSEFGIVLIEAEGPLVGQYARFTGGIVHGADGDVTIGDVIGVVIAEDSGRIIIAVEEEFGVYSLLGWLSPSDDFEIITLLIEEHRWHH